MRGLIQHQRSAVSLPLHFSTTLTLSRLHPCVKPHQTAPHWCANDWNRGSREEYCTLQSRHTDGSHLHHRSLCKDADCGTFLCFTEKMRQLGASRTTCAALTRTHAHKHSSTQMGRRVAVVCVRKRLECISVAEASCLIWSGAGRYWQQLQGQWGGWARAWEGGAFWNTGEVADGPICSWEARLKAAGKLDSTLELWEKMTRVQLHPFVPVLNSYFYLKILLFRSALLMMKWSSLWEHVVYS